MEIRAPSPAPQAEKFVDFVDSRRLFSCRLPANFLRAEREKDKRGTVFVSGNYEKAEVLSVQVVAAADLLTDAGMTWLPPNAVVLHILARLISSFRAPEYRVQSDPLYSRIDKAFLA